MTDRELMELAAKAAGIEVRWHGGWNCFVRVRPFNLDSPPTLAGQRHPWTPLHDDGDALRLAVVLQRKTKWEVILYFREDSTAATTDSDEDIYEYYGADPFAATRRAIVRAAAEIGEKS